MLARNRLHAAPVSACALSLAAAAIVAGCAILTGCARRPAMCGRSCDDGFSCVSGECLRGDSVRDVEGLDKFGVYQARHLVLSPVDVVRLAPGDERAEAPRVATLGRARDAASVLLFRFALDLPPGAVLLAADLVLDRSSAFDPDPSPILLHAARIAEPWDARSVAWGRAPRLEDVGAPVTTVDDARPSIRLDVRSLVRRWRRHARDDQGIAVVADRSSVTGIAFALADDSRASEANAPALSVRPLKDTPPVFHATAEDSPAEPAAPRAPRLELYVKP